MALFDPAINFDYSSSAFDLENQARAAANAAYTSASSKQSSSKKSVADTSDLDAQIKILKSAMKEASGFKRRELKVRLEEAEKERESRIEAARIGAEASKYGSDKSLEGTKYSSDAGERNSQRSLEGTKYSSDSSAAASRYGTDADLYKFNAEQPTKRAEQALGFLKTYTDLSSRPDSWLQASNYGRLGYQVEGMPAMMSDLLGNVNPNGAPVPSGNIAFRSGTGAMPMTAGQAIFGDNPLNLGTRAPMPEMPTWTGPSGQQYTAPTPMSVAFAGSGGGSYAPSYGSGDHRGKLVSDTYGVQSAQANAPTRAVATQQDVRLGAATPSVISAMPYGNGGFFPTGYGAKPDASQEAAAAGLTSGIARMPYPNGGIVKATTYGTASDVVRGNVPSNGGFIGPSRTTTQQSAQPRILNGGVVPNEQAGEQAFIEGTRQILQRGAHRLGGQDLARMTQTERDMLSSGIKAAGGVPNDFFEAYSRSRVGNDGSARGL